MMERFFAEPGPFFRDYGMTAPSMASPLAPDGASPAGRPGAISRPLISEGMAAQPHPVVMPPFDTTTLILLGVARSCMAMFLITWRLSVRLDKLFLRPCDVVAELCAGGGGGAGR